MDIQVLHPAQQGGSIKKHAWSAARLPIPCVQCVDPVCTSYQLQMPLLVHSVFDYYVSIQSKGNNIGNP
eukprot:1556007-Ditylum_brightwellii.AAC.1